MKSIVFSFRMLALALALLVVTATAQAQTPVTLYSHPFLANGTIQNISAADATGYKSKTAVNDQWYNSGAGGFVWCGYQQNTQALANLRFDTNAVLKFNAQSLYTPNFFYTHFDTHATLNSSTDPTSYNTPGLIFNGSDPSSKIIFNESSYTYNATSTLGVLIYDGSSWYESDQAQPHPGSSLFQPDVFPLSGVTWNKVNTTTSFYCLSGTSGGFGFSGTGTPTLSTIQGLGLYVRQGPGTTNALSFIGFDLVGQPPQDVTNTTGGVSDNLKTNTQSFLDQSGGNENIRRTDAGSKFAWGGYVPNSATVGLAGVPAADFQNTLYNTGGVKCNLIRRPCVVKDARSYTRFDTLTPYDGNLTAGPGVEGNLAGYGAIVPAYSVNLGGANAGLHLQAHFEPGTSTLTKTMTGVRIAALIRSSDGFWYQSNDQGFPDDELADGQQNLNWPTTSTTWTQVVMTTGSGGWDMDNVNNNGQAALTLNMGSTTPDLTAVQGMGYVLTQSSTENTPASINPITNDSGLAITNCSVQTDVMPPAIPTGVSATPYPNGGEVDLSWASVGDTDLRGYNVYRTTSANSPYFYTLIGTTATNGTLGSPYKDTSVTNNKTYYYVVTAWDNATPVNNESAWSFRSAPVTPADTQAPNPPAITLSNNYYTDKVYVSIDTTASSAPDLAGFNVWRSNTGDSGTYAKLNTVGLVLPTQVDNDPNKLNTGKVYYEDATAVDGNSYYYAVSAQDNLGNDSFNAAVPLQTNGVVTAATPLNLHGGSDPSGNVTLNWTAARDGAAILGYNVYRGTATGLYDPTPVATDTATTTTVHDTVALGQAYYYVVRAYSQPASSEVESPNSNELSVTPADTIPPDQPSNFKAHGGAVSQQISLSWDADTDLPKDADLSSYLVYRSTSASGPFDTPLVTLGKTTSYNDTGLTNGTTYYYELEAEDSSSNLSPVATASATANLPPTTPVLTLVHGVNGHQINASWPASPDSDFAAFELYRDTVNNGQSWPGGTLISSGTSLSFASTSLTNGTKYYFGVRAEDADSNFSTFSTGNSTAVPQTPAAPIVTCSATQKLTVTFPTPNTGDSDTTLAFLIYRGTSVAAATQQPNATTVFPIPATNWADTATLVNGTDYHYYLKIKDTATGAVSDAGLDTVGSPMAAPTGLAFDNITEYKQLSFTWTKNTEANVDHYIVERSDGNNSTFVQMNVTVAQPASGKPAFKDNGQYKNMTGGAMPLANGTTYWYRVSAGNTHGQIGPNSGTGSSRICQAFLATPSGLQAHGGTVSSQVSLNWNANPTTETLTGYAVYRGTAAGAEAATAVGTSAVTNYTDSSVTNGVKYYYTIKATGSDGFLSTVSNEASTTAAAPPSQPATPTISHPSDQKLSLDWTANAANEAITGYNVYRGTAPGAEAATAVGTPAGTHFDDPGLVDGTVYYYQIAAVDADGNVSAKSAEVHDTPVQAITITTPSGLKATVGHASGVISLSWTASTGSGLAGYNVYRAPSVSGPFTKLNTSGVVSGTTYDNSGLANGTLYWYYVTAQTTTGAETVPSNTVTASAQKPGGVTAAHNWGQFE